MWTQFWDMHSGGDQKLDWPNIFIEASEDEAKVIFYNRFDRNPERVTCTCCGGDYSISEYETLEKATEFHRRHIGTLEEYLKTGGAHVIYAADIKDPERIGDVPEEGYVWAD